MNKSKTVFISYSWDSDEHKEWVLNLANYLIENGGCDVTLDQYDLNAGNNMIHFMERAVTEADKVLLILTPNYKLKADQRQGGVGLEYSMISQGLYTMQVNNNKFIPILRAGDLTISAPTYVQTSIYLDMSDDMLFERVAYKLLRNIYNKPELVKPKKGAIPNFNINESSKNTHKPKQEGFATTASKILKAKQLAKDIENLNNSEVGVTTVVQSAERIFNTIKINATAYSEAMKFPIHIEVYNNYNSLRLQAGDYYVIADYIGYTNKQVRLISIRLTSGVDRYYKPSRNNEVLGIINTLYKSEKGLKFFPKFNDEKQVFWECNEIRYTENDVVEEAFTLLLKAMSDDTE